MNAAAGVPDAAAVRGAQEPSRAAVAVAAACGGMVALIVAFRAVVTNVPMLWFDVDPALDPTPFAGIGPSTSLLLDAAVLLLSAAAVFALRQSIARGAAVIALLAAFGAVPVVVHGLRGADDCWRGMQWMSAIGGAAALAACITAMPRVRAAAVRSVVLGVLLGAGAVILARGAFQLAVEHPATVLHYQAHRAEVLASHGWTDGSPQALTYERRLMQPEATGWFGLSNVASSVLAATAVACAWGAAALWRERRAAAAVLAVAAAAAAAVVAINGSKGAIGALAVAAAFSAWCWWKRPSGARRGWVAGACVAMVVLLVVLRGVVGEASAERSLLFRSQYMDAALRMFAAHPGFGVGPAGFGDAYLLLRPDRSPEEVQSAHAAWADWLASLGLWSLPWIALWAAFARGAAAVSAAEAPAAPGSALALTRGPWIAAAAVLVAGTVGVSVESTALDPVTLACRLLGVAFGAVVAGACVRAALDGGRAWAAGLAAAALLLAMHANVEMTLWWPGAVGWVASFVFVAGANPGVHGIQAPAPGAPWMRWCVTLALAGLLAPAALALASASRAGAAEAVIDAAARPIAAHRLAASHAQDATVPGTAIADDRLEAAQRLCAEDGNPWLGGRPAVLAAGIGQAARAVVDSPRAPDQSALHTLRCRRALGMGVAALRAGAPESVAASVASLAEVLLREPPECVDRAAVVRLLRDAARRQVACDPRSVRGWIRVSEAAALSGDRDAARTAAERALAADDSLALDPVRMLPAQERARVEDAAHGGRPLLPADPSDRAPAGR